MTDNKQTFRFITYLTIYLVYAKDHKEATRIFIKINESKQKATQNKSFDLYSQSILN